VTRQHRKFNAYLRGIPDEPLWEPGDFLVHFAGVYDLKQMEELAAKCACGEKVRLPLQPGEIQACTQSRDTYIRVIQG
jgi:hypothetical protein